MLKLKKIYNSKCLQHPLTTACGQWCLYFIYHCCVCNESLSDMLKIFAYNRDLLYNDHIMNELVCEKFETKQKVITKVFLESMINKTKKKEKKNYSQKCINICTTIFCSYYLCKNNKLAKIALDKI